MLIDFYSQKLNYRRNHGGGNGQPIAKAIGIKRYGLPLNIIDATAGFGTDSFILATLGCQVTMYERCSKIAVALQQAIDAANQNPEICSIAKNLKLIPEDSIVSLKKLLAQPDVVYLDPMFPKRKKSSLVKKEMRELQDIVGLDQDSDELLGVALKVAKKRVVVKRPKSAPFLANLKPTHQLLGSSGRFDIYIPNQP